MQTIRRHITKFDTALFASIIAIFILNSGHVSQQTIFLNQYSTLAKHLLNGEGYSLLPGVPTLYPIWGYPLLVLIGQSIGSASLFIAFVQAALCYASIKISYNVFYGKPRVWHILLLIPYIAFMSVRWPDAICGALLMILVATLYDVVKTSSIRSALLSGIIIGLLSNFRSEFLGLEALLCASIVVVFFKGQRRYAKLLTYSFITAIVFMIPWSIYSYSVDRHVRFSSTNGGGVLYISLGQLPGNPWNIVPVDSTAYHFATQNKIADPYSQSGDSSLTHAFLEDVESHPVAFTEKIFYNTAMILARGVYTGEYAGFFAGKISYYETLLRLDDAKDFKDRLSILQELPTVFSFSLVLEKIIHAIFILAFDLIILGFLLSLIKLPMRQSLKWICAAIVVYKIFLVGFIQFEPRHLNSIYLLVLMPSILYFENYIQRRAEKRKIMKNASSSEIPLSR